MYRGQYGEFVCWQFFFILFADILRSFLCSCQSLQKAPHIHREDRLCIQGKTPSWDASSYLLHLWQCLSWYVARSRESVYADYVSILWHILYLGLFVTVENILSKWLIRLYTFLWVLQSSVFLAPGLLAKRGRKVWDENENEQDLSYMASNVAEVILRVEILSWT